MNHGYLYSIRGPGVPSRPRGAVQAASDRLCRQRQRPRPGRGDPDPDRHQHRQPPITVGNQPFGIAITPNGKTAYVTGGPDLVTPIRTATNTAGPPITVGTGPDAIAIT